MTMSLAPSKVLPFTLTHHSLSPSFPYPRPRPSCPSRQTLRILCAKRTGKQRYPSEKKKLKLKLKQKQALGDVKNKFEGTWRLSKLAVPVHDDPGKDFLGVSDGLLQEIARVLEFPVASMLPAEAFCVVRKSFDARKMLKGPKFVYTVDMDANKLLHLEPRTWDFISRLEPKVGIVERMLNKKGSGDLISMINDCKKSHEATLSRESDNDLKAGSGRQWTSNSIRVPKIAVVGSGPSGLFASLVLAELGADVTLIERGQPVEQRGRDIGALVVRRILQLDSNFCFGEGGAGTWSDGKLVTRIGRNSECVLAVMKTLVHFGAPKSILVNGKPHLGTDRLVPLLRNFRRHLQQLGVNIMFGSRMDDLLVENGQVVGVKVSQSSDKSLFDSEKLTSDAVILAVGHSARDVYQMLLSHNVELVPKDIAYSKLASGVRGGRGKVPVADYKVAKHVRGEDIDSSPSLGTNRACYSFCMCPGGQVVLTSTDPSELCINGMSFSRRSSKWANAALVVTVSGSEFNSLNCSGPMAGVYFQRDLEKKAAIMGGGNFVVPVQTVTDFLENKLSGTSVPPSSYRLGVKAANLHNLFPIHITEALKRSIAAFDQELPGFISKDALLHGVETRTSSPVQIPRSSDTYESVSLRGLYPIGEGAGYAGGIVSAAVDGMYAGLAVAKNFDLLPDGIEAILGRAYGTGFVNY
ncbi:uncharacterized protein Cbei_0202 isoform X2 [Rhodamnia argentea]|uniref:Uncharacterized protein Cbei_0202 isoform X2 n=1 Tax=Rhodamnia argentea TaxID=178133 RepID=A0A8B8NM62_9MYRT|nr:uncharacterized protein Cbei_0202 isoform X2 [Rhodamnia argentea]